MENDVKENQSETDDKQYYLHIGCHKGTLMSRDVDNPRPFSTYDEAYNNYIESKESWARFGYMMWFAKIVAPDGAETHLESNPYW